MRVLQFVPTPTDDPLARELLTEYFTSRQLGFISRPEGYRVVFPDTSAFLPPAGVFFVVREEADGASRVLGCGGIRMLDAERAEVKHLWIREHARGLGVGRALLLALEQAARAFGASTAVLDTNQSLTAAQQLYRSAGYAETEPYNDNPNATHWFEKSLQRRRTQ